MQSGICRLEYQKRRTPGPDGITVEILQTIDNDTIDVMVNLYNRLYGTAVMLTKWLISTFITIRQKHNAKECSGYRQISLLSTH